MGKIYLSQYPYNLTLNYTNGATALKCKTLSEVKSFLRRYAQHGVTFTVGKSYLQDTNDTFISHGNMINEGKNDILGYEFKKYVLTITTSITSYCYFDNKLELKRFIGDITSTNTITYNITENTYKVEASQSVTYGLILTRAQKSLTFADL